MAGRVVTAAAAAAQLLCYLIAWAMVLLFALYQFFAVVAEYTWVYDDPEDGWAKLRAWILIK
jgi:hypothetical protein